MKPPEYYKGREQTYLKHFFLDHYLERVAYNIGSFADEFVYVDGFSGPWRAQGEELEDTSFMIAIKKLQSVQKALAEKGRPLNLRCIFVEKNPHSFATLQKAASPTTGLQIETLNGEFAELIPQILQKIGRAFSLVFIDPTGWKIPLDLIAPILRHRPGEVLINFMFDYINRFLSHLNDEVEQEIDRLFGGQGWKGMIREGSDREDSIIRLYLDRVRHAGGFDYVTSTRILKPLQDRSYFYLVYGTRHPKGLIEFRKVEKAAVAEQERVRLGAQKAHRFERSGQHEFFFTEETQSGTARYEVHRAQNLGRAAREMEDRLRKSGDIQYDKLLPLLLQIPLVWESDVKDLIKRGQADGTLSVVGLAPDERTPKLGRAHFIRSRIAPR